MIGLIGLALYHPLKKGEGEAVHDFHIFSTFLTY